MVFQVGAVLLFPPAFSAQLFHLFFPEFIIIFCSVFGLYLGSFASTRTSTTSNLFP